MDANQKNRQNTQPDTNDEESNQCNDRHQQDELPQDQQSSKWSESGHEIRSRANSRPASGGSPSRSQSNPRPNKAWNSTNAFINFMHDFRTMHAGQRSANIFRLGGEQWRNMTEDQKHPFVDAASKNKKLKQNESLKNKQQKQNTKNKSQSKTDTGNDNAPNKSTASRQVPSSKKRKAHEPKQERQLKKKHNKSDTETDADTDSSASIHTATTDCASEDSNESSQGTMTS